jgi:hypothetical protein
VAQQRAMLQNNGMSAKQIAHSKLAIIEGEVID